MDMRDLLKKPFFVAMIALIIGIILGLIWAWGIQPVEWKDAPPSLLHQGYQEEYLRMAIDSYKVNNDRELALRRYQALGEIRPTLLATVVANPGSQDASAILSFADLVQASEAPGTGDAPGSPSVETPQSPVTSYVVIVLGVLVVGAVGYAFVRFIRPGSRRGTGQATPAQHAREITRQTSITDYEALGEEPPIAQFVTTYVQGDDLFDDSFSIDSPAGEFLGECGVGISETIGVGEPKKVSAFEIWLFDKNDIQTVTKVLMSAHAYNDVATFQRLDAKGEPILVERGRQVILETAALQLVAVVADMDYGKGPLPDSSHFERLTLEIAVWPKITGP